jgi:hypothetical protein
VRIRMFDPGRIMFRNKQYMKLIAMALVITGTFLNAVYSQGAVTVSVNTSSPGWLIPEEFIGFSFETRRVNYNSEGVTGYFFDSTNTQAVTLFRQLGVKSLRVGGGSVDSAETPIPT